jgi:dinuclear metal center YbgI/SA1388 family protein
MKIRDIIDAIEAYAPPALQESFDNTGYQVGNPDAEATGALLCVDVTEDVVAEAQSKGYNLIISHHPLLFRGVKSVVGFDRPQRTLMAAIRANVTVYSSHTAMDSTLGGVSFRMAQKLNLCNVKTLVPSHPGAETGLGVVGDCAATLTVTQLVELTKQAFGCKVLRMSKPADALSINRIALCGGAGAEFLPQAIASGAQAFITADCRLNQFLDFAPDILLIDAGHFETEACAREIFSDILTEKFPNFAVCYSGLEHNPVIYC